MLIFEKNNKLNINFDPSKSIEGTPDIQIGENEIKLGDAEITSENVLPTPTNEDVGKIVSVGEDGSYELVPFQEPTGKIEITENGIVDVADYAGADVNVPTPFDGKYIQFVNNYGKNIKLNYVDNSGMVHNAILANGATKNVPISVTTYKDKQGNTMYYGFVTIASNDIVSALGAATISGATAYSTESFAVFFCSQTGTWANPVVTIPERQENINND